MLKLPFCALKTINENVRLLTLNFTRRIFFCRALVSSFRSQQQSHRRLANKTDFLHMQLEVLCLMLKILKMKQLESCQLYKCTRINIKHVCHKKQEATNIFFSQFYLVFYMISRVITKTQMNKFKSYDSKTLNNIQIILLFKIYI